MAERDNDRTPSSARRAPGFCNGDLLGGRYRIIRLVGEGGMGEVYEADDQFLRERVALKTVKPDVASDDKVIQRFKREIQLARRVTHPNVCRIFDVGLHRPGRGCRDVAFLTMELLEGETLACRLARAGRLSTKEAEPLVASMACALDAAHDAGVIHRDFKPANVVLTTGEGGQPRPVITDFGLACGIARVADPTVTGDGGVVGSPSYMAPEQVEGKEITGAADVYALGVVMYEMVTGKLPFVADSPLSTAVMRLREDPLPPSAHVSGLPAAWEKVILRCLQRDPAARPASASAALLELAETPRRARPSFRRMAAAVALTLAAAGVLATVVAASHRGVTPAPALAPVPAPAPALAIAPAPAPEGGRRSVAVLGFRNLTGRAQEGWIGDALAEMLSTELAGSDDISMICGETVVRAKKELSLGDEVSFAPDTLARLHAALGADLVLTGSYVALGREGRFRLDLRLIDARNGETLAILSQTGTEEDLGELVASTGRAMRERLSVAELSPDELRSVRALQPRADVSRLYAEGLAHLRVAACSAARGPLEQAVAVDPTYALARSALAEALACLGYDERAVDEARRAVELSASLPEQVRLATEGRLDLVNRQPEKALAVYQKLFQLFPDNFDYGLQLAHLQLRLMRERDLRVTLAALHALREPMGQSPRIALVEAMLAVLEGHPDDGLARAAAARAAAEEQGMRLVVADALMVETHIHADAEHGAEALAAIAKARAIYEAAGDLDGIAAALSIEAYVRQGAGDLKGVKRAEDQILGIARDLDNPREVLRLKRLLGVRLASQGDLRGALKALDDALEIARGRHDADTIAAIVSYGAWLFMENGDLDGAAAMAREALVEGVSPGQRAALLQVQATLAAVNDDFAAAHASLDEAQKLPEVDDEASRAQLLASSAFVLVLEERYQDAEKAARAAVAAGGALAPLARFTLAMALVGERRYREALVELHELEGTPSFKPFPQAVELAALRAQARLGAGIEGGAARADLDAAIARARGGSFRYSELDARLRLGGVLVERGDDRGRALLGDVARDADRLGYKLLARRARGKAG